MQKASFSVLQQTQKRIWSQEFIEHTLMRQVQNLLNLRCYDLGYTPYNQTPNKFKFWGPPYRSSPLNQVSTQQFMIKSVSIDSTLEELMFEHQAEVIIKNCLFELKEKESDLVDLQTVKIIQKTVEKYSQAQGVKLRYIRDELINLYGISQVSEPAADAFDRK
ncbi:UNKNOWN [Stylonychia lemnae]|uniref:Uncharacterized protein n=1 Tax=Stylonychia lemnae TaxID=5949 RepID=A0A078A0R0_STYLE|nr:UNKNOWN [Stylonychia lemnae]|eukprot:CDW75725.1 UNKNOWN [Stylonychia lemnae]